MSVFAAPGAYDRAITVFSPDGRLFQVEYAMELVNRGATILGIRCAEGVVLGSEENVEPLEEAEFSWKLFKVDEHIGAAIVGLSSDARILIDQARVYAQSNKLTYDEPIDVEVVTKRISDIKQMYTQHAGVRPFSVDNFCRSRQDRRPHILHSPQRNISRLQGHSNRSRKGNSARHSERGTPRRHESRRCHKVGCKVPD